MKHLDDLLAYSSEPLLVSSVMTIGKLRNVHSVSFCSASLNLYDHLNPGLVLSKALSIHCSCAERLVCTSCTTFDSGALGPFNFTRSLVMGCCRFDNELPEYVQ